MTDDADIINTRYSDLIQDSQTPSTCKGFYESCNLQLGSVHVTDSDVITFYKVDDLPEEDFDIFRMELDNPAESGWEDEGYHLSDGVFGRNLRKPFEVKNEPTSLLSENVKADSEAFVVYERDATGEDEEMATPDPENCIKMDEDVVQVENFGAKIESSYSEPSKNAILVDEESIIVPSASAEELLESEIEAQRMVNFIIHANHAENIERLENEQRRKTHLIPLDSDDSDKDDEMQAHGQTVEHVGYGYLRTNDDDDDIVKQIKNYPKRAVAQTDRCPAPAPKKIRAGSKNTSQEMITKTNPLKF